MLLSLYQSVCGVEALLDGPGALFRVLRGHQNVWSDGPRVKREIVVKKCENQ